MGERGAAFSREQGRRTAANLRELGVNVDLAPVLDVARPGGTIAATERGFGATAARVAATAVPFADGLQAGGVAATAKHFPGLGAAAENTDFAVQRIDLSKRSPARRSTRRPTGAFVAAGGDLVMLSTAIYPALSPDPAAFAARDRDRRAARPARLRGRLGHRRARHRRGAGLRRPGEGRRRRRPGPAPTCCSSPTSAPAEAAWRALVAKLRAGTLDRERVRGLGAAGARPARELAARAS